MSVVAPITDTTLFLYAIVTSTKCKIDFSAVGAALNLKTGTASMRYQRLRQRLEKMSNPPTTSSAKGSLDENSLYLYQCIMASGCKPDWKTVGVATNLKAGTASMRWRRLQEKIARDHGPTAGLLDNTTTVASTTQTQNAANPKKRKADPVEIVVESDGENDNKRVKLEHAEPGLDSDSKKTKLEEADTTPEKRQTRGKKLDLKYMLDSSSSSGAGISSTAPTTSLYEDSAAEQPDDGEDLDSEVKEKLDIRKQTKVPAAASPVKNGNARKVPRGKAPIMPMSAAHGAQGNPCPTPNRTTATNDVRPMPTPASSTFPVLVKSIESDDHANVQAELDGLRDGGFVKANRASHSTVTSSSVEYFDSARESMVLSGASSVEVQVPTEADPMELDDMVSVSPDDSISMVGTKKPGGNKRKNVGVPRKETGILGKFWNLLG